MKASKAIKAVCTLGLVSACALTFVGCSGNSQGLTGGVAATVNGVEIPEDKVTTLVQNMRTTSSLETEEKWGAALSQYGMTPESYREQVINYFVEEELIKQAGKENGITIPASEIDSKVNETKAKIGGDAAWQKALKEKGMTEQEYRDSVELGLVKNQLTEKVVPKADSSEESKLEYAKMYASAYDGAKRSSHILFKSEEGAKAQEVLDKINSGELDFAQAATEYSQDSGSAAKGGDVGWDKLSSFVTAYTDGLNPLEKDQVSGLVTSDYGIHVIKCTDVFNAPEEVTDISQLPAEFQEKINTSLSASDSATAFQTWLDAYKEKAEININPIPEKAPYKVDMSKYSASTGTSTGQ